MQMYAYIYRYMYIHVDADYVSEFLIVDNVSKGDSFGKNRTNPLEKMPENSAFPGHAVWWLLLWLPQREK